MPKSPVASSCENGNETVSSMEARKFRDQLSENYFLKKDSVLWS